VDDSHAPSTLLEPARREVTRDPHSATGARTPMIPRVAIATVSLLVGACGAAEAPAPTPPTTVATPGPASPSSASVPVHRAKLEVVRVDDTIDAFATVPDESLPDGQGASIHSEYAPVGPGKNVKTTFLRVVSRDGERTTATLARIRPWLATVRLPAGAASASRMSSRRTRTRARRPRWAFARSSWSGTPSSAPTT
jgi:hypothetical protein